MSARNNFEKQEWEMLQYSILAVFRKVAGADGVIDKKENLALKTIADNSTYFQGELTQELLHSIASSPGHFFRKSVSVAEKPEDIMIAVKGIIKEHISDKDAVLFQKNLVAIGYYIANASGDIDGKKMSDEEAQELAIIAHGLGLSTQSLLARPTIQQILENIEKF